MPKIMGLSESYANRQVHSSKGHMENSELSYTNDLTAQLKGLEQKEYTQKRNKWQETIKLEPEINDIETKTTIQRSNKTRFGVFKKSTK